jgi:hypothetical protein
MKKIASGNFLIALIGWGTVLFASEAIIYYTRWLVPLLSGHPSHVAPPLKFPQLWFIGKIASNAVFLWVAILLLRLYKNYRKLGYFEKDSIRLLDKVILACLFLAAIGMVQTGCEYAAELRTDQWTSLWAIANRVYRSFNRLFVLKEPQTMYLLLAAILWGIRQFVIQALNVKKENELFI